MKVVKAAGRTDDGERALRAALVRAAPRPRAEFRREAWLAFQVALERHLATRRRRGQWR